MYASPIPSKRGIGGGDIGKGRKAKQGIFRSIALTLTLSQRERGLYSQREKGPHFQREKGLYSQREMGLYSQRERGPQSQRERTNLPNSGLN